MKIDFSYLPTLRLTRKQVKSGIQVASSDGDKAIEVIDEIERKPPPKKTGRAKRNPRVKG